MASVGVNVIETAALGRPFQLGMLYDCRKDALIPGITLWDPENLKQSLRDRPQIISDFKVTASDSIEDKSNLLNIDGSLKLSVLGGLINVDGSAKYLNDTKKSFKQQRLTLRYHSTCRFEELTMNHLASEKIVHHEVFDNDTATHVVTAVLYGADACFVFDREVSSDEKVKTVEGEAKVAFEKLKIISVDANVSLKMNDTQKNAVRKFTCTFYGDFQLPSNPTTFEDALKVFTDLPKLLGEKKELAVPLRVWLYPLDKLHSGASKLQKDISMDLILEIESVIESLNTTEMKCNDLLKDSPALTFTEFHDKILQMKQNCYKYKLRLLKKLGSLLPDIRGDVMKETDLNDLLQEHDESPFSGRDLAEWLKERERESDVIKLILRQLKDAGAQAEVNIDLISMDLDVGNVVCYTFTSLNWSDVLLPKQKAHLSMSAKGKTDENSPDSEQKSWLTPEIRETLWTNLKMFKNLIDSKDRKPAKFIVSSKEMKNNPGSCILLYEHGHYEAVCFIPPSQPACPITEEVKDKSVVLKVPPSCPATVEIRLLYKQKKDTDWTSKPVMKDQLTVTLTDLRAGTEYEIKCAALGKLNYTVYSDVIRVTTEGRSSLIVAAGDTGEDERREDQRSTEASKVTQTDPAGKIQKTQKATKAVHFQSHSNSESTGKRRYCGLEDRGSTSSLNAVLQTLFMTKEFRKHVESLDRRAVSSDGDFIKELKKLFNELETQERNAVSAAEIKKSLGITDVHKRDAAELLRLILEKTPGSSELFRCTMKKTACWSCRDKPEEILKEFLSLPVYVQNSQDVEDALQAYAHGNKRVESVHCFHCKRITDMDITKRETMKFPEHLIIQLKISETYSSHGSSSSKNDQEVILRPHIKVSSHRYELYAVVNYDGGRYNADIKCEDEIWRRFEDCKVSKSPLNTVFINEISTLRSSDARLLVYRHREQSGVFV